MSTRKSRLKGAASALTILPAGALTLGLLAALPPTPAQAQAPGATLKVLTPRAGEADGAKSFALDVAFQSRTGSPVTVAELWVDGVRWVHRSLDTPQTKNVLSFAVDASSLAEGTHDVVVKVICANGAVSQTQIQVQAGDNEGVVDGALGGPDITFQTPGNGRHVQGSVELVLDAPAKNGANPYVTIYIDKQFKTLKNYPPYSYTWDTTTVPNGLHTIEATGYIDSSSPSTTRRIKVFVDNPGGNTTIQKELPDLASGTLPNAAATTVSRVPASSVRVAKTKAGSVATVSKKTFVAPMIDLTSSDEPAVSAANIASVEAIGTVRPLGLAEVHKSVATTAGVAKGVALLAPTAAAPAHHKSALMRSAAHHSALEAVSPAVGEVGAAPMASIASPSLAVKPASPLHMVAPQFETGVVSTMSTSHMVRFASHHRRHTALSLAANAAGSLGSHSLRAGSIQVVAPASVLAGGGAHRHMSAYGPHRSAAIKPSSAGMLRIVDGAPFQVAFDGQQIAFDVPPRVEAGLPLAPFRQIFEHTGGQVEWHPQGQIVRAVNADREIVIAVGSAAAQVNGQTVTMQRPAFVERGRTIVPLSFVGKALDCNVKYDPATGHLEITSK